MSVDIFHDTLRTEARLRGALDGTTAHQLDEALDRIIADGRLHVVLDLGELDFLAAAGLRVFVRADAVLRAAGGSLALTEPSRSIRRVLAVTQLDRTLTVD
jgi:anti-sigma B factor antagonist